MVAISVPARRALLATPAWWIGLDAGHQDIVRARRDALRIADALLPAASTVCVHADGGGRVLLSYELPDDGVPTPDQLASLVLDEGAGVTVIGADGCIDVALGDLGRRTRAALAAQALLMRADGNAVRFAGDSSMSGLLSAHQVLTETAIERLDPCGGELTSSSTVVVSEPVTPRFHRGLLSLALAQISPGIFRPIAA